MAPEEPCVPELSVVVATRNRASLLPRLVRALEAQEGAPPFELVVVDDGSTDDTPAVLAQLAASSPIELHVHRLAHSRGPAAARNVGWRASRAPMIAFTDDDCIPQPRWLAEISSGLQRSDIAQGTTMANPQQAMRGIFSRAPQASYERGFYETCNIGYRTATLATVDGFDEGFGPRRGRPTWGEDTDLAWRAKEAGARTTFVGGAVVWHDMTSGRLRDELADLPRRGGNALLVRRHPGVRHSFESPWFVQAAHAPALGTVAATAAALLRPRSLARWLAAAAFFAAWARRRGAYNPKREWPRTLPQWFVVDVADVAVMAVASARNRSLLL
jgi:glycosyltransferase involved in cell wall biosynthesis